MTLIDEDLAQRAGLRGPREPIHIEGIGDAPVDTTSSRRLNIILNGSGRRHRITARSIKHLKLSPQTVTEEDLKGCQHLKDIIREVQYSGAKPQVLIGQDNWPLLLAKDSRIGNRHQPVASLMPLGWVLHGACSRTTGHRVHFVQPIESEKENLDIDIKLKNFFSLEALTIVPKTPRSDPEAKALKILENKITTLEDGRFQTALLWKNEDIKLPGKLFGQPKKPNISRQETGRSPD